MIKRTGSAKQSHSDWLDTLPYLHSKTMSIAGSLRLWRVRLHLESQTHLTGSDSSIQFTLTG